MCGKCGGSGELYEGNGHRMASYPFAEKGVFVGVCHCGGRARKECTPEEVQLYKDQRKARVAHTVAKINASYIADMRVLNVRREAAGLSPLPFVE